MKKGEKISQNSQENTCARASLLIKRALAQVFFCDLCEISKNNIFHRTPLVADSVHSYENIAKTLEHLI